MQIQIGSGKYSYTCSVWITESNSLDSLCHTLAEAKKEIKRLVKCTDSYIDAYIRKYDEKAGYDICDYDINGRIKNRYF